MEYAPLAVFVAIVIAQHWVTGRFLAEVERDNPDKYEEIWPRSESLLATLLPFRFGILYVLPGTYEDWNLGPSGSRWAGRVKVVTWLVIFSMLGIFALIIASLV